MKKIGLIAGGGQLPLEFVKAVKNSSAKVIVFAIKNIASESLNEIDVKVYWLNLDQYAKFIFLMLKEGIKDLALLGKVKKEEIYADMSDEDRTDFFKSVNNKNDYTLLEALTKKLSLAGIKVIDTSPYLTHLIPERGVLTSASPNSRIEIDMDFGYSIAKKLADIDIGQTVIIKDKAIVAVEAMEGTDKTIIRGKEICGDGCVMVKVSRSNQDMRWDVPTVGPDTMEKLSKNNFSALAIESGTMYLVEKEKTLSIAEANGIILKAL